MISLSRTKPLYYLDDRVRTGEKAEHVRKALLGFGFHHNNFIAFATAVKHQDVIAGTTDVEVYKFLDNLSYLFSRRALLYTEGKIVHQGSYHEISMPNVPVEILDALNLADDILFNLKNKIDAI